MNRTLLRLGTAVLAPAAALSVAAAPADAAAPSDGCPAGYTLLSVGALWTEGYRVPSQVDSATSGYRSFGRAGNDDGWVCGVQMGNQVTGWGGPSSNFLDNQLPV